MLRFLLLIIVLFFLVRAVIRFLAGRFLKKQWPFQSLHRYGSKGTSASRVAEEADFEVIETHIKEKEGSS